MKIDLVCLLYLKDRPCKKIIILFESENNGKNAGNGRQTASSEMNILMSEYLLPKRYFSMQNFILIQLLVKIENSMYTHHTFSEKWHLVKTAGRP